MNVLFTVPCTDGLGQSCCGRGTAALQSELDADDAAYGLSIRNPYLGTGVGAAQSPEDDARVGVVGAITKIVLQLDEAYGQSLNRAVVLFGLGRRTEQTQQQRERRKPASHR